MAIKPYMVQGKRFYEVRVKMRDSQGRQLCRRRAERFEKIGLPNPDHLGPFVGSFEAACGLLVLLGLFIRIAELPLLVVMRVAIISTKTPIILEKGVFEMAHAERTDFSIFLGSLFLFINGGGGLSLDHYISLSQR